MERSYNFASINFLVELGMIEKMLEGISRGYDSVIALALPTGETIVFRETGSHEFSIETVPTLAAAFSGRTDYSTLVSYSEKTEATFYIASRIPLMYAHIIRLQIISYALLALLLLAALAVSYLFSKRNSAPIQQLARVFTSRQQNQPGSSNFNNEDEISFIRQMINITIDENMKMNQVMLASSNLLSQQTMMLLFHGVLNNRAVVNQMMELSNLVLDEGHYAVLLVSAGSKDKNETVNVDACYEKLWALPECDLGCNIMIEDQKVMALLVGLPNEDASKIQRMNICRRLVQACSSNCDVSAKICSSRVYDDIEQVNQAYIEAVYVFKANQSKINSTQLTFFDDILTFDLPIVTLSKKETDVFQNAVRALDKNKMELRFDYIMQLIQKEDISENTRTAMRYRILNLLLHCVMEMGIEQDILSDIMDIDPSQNEVFRQQMAIVFDKISLQKNAPTEGAFNEILHDLHENYGDVNLSLERVAQRAGLSKAYVSRLFKLKTGKRYIDYLTDIRMKETMKLLVNTKLSVREITQKVGYYDVASFQKKFKMLYGLSPAKYRDAHGNNLIDDDTPSSVNGNRHPAGISKKL
jgi:AraC-like DNA-binding protein